MPKILIQDDRLDANESAYANRELESVRSKVYETRFPQFKGRTLIPVNNQDGPGVDTIVWMEFDVFGMAQVIANYANDLPKVNVAGKENRVPVRSVGLSYGYSIKDMQRAARTGRSLSDKLAQAARRGIEQKIDSIAFIGDSAHGLVGLLTHPNVPLVTAPNGAGGTATFATKTAAEMLKDLHALANAIVTTTKEAEQPNTLTLPVAQYTLCATTRMSADDATSVLKAFLDSSPYISEVIPCDKLKGAGTGGVDVMAAYDRSPDVLELVIPVEFTQEPPQRKGMVWDTDCTADVAGVIVYRPMAIRIMEGI